jgi:membrane-associated phospholipid phosphatase/protein-S-isoprenylcysteine O-methyltransferase Ste14
MMGCESSARPTTRRANVVVWSIALALLALGPASFLWFDRPAMSALSRTSANWDNGFWMHAFTRLGKAWLEIWLLLVWFWVARRRREVLAGLLALILVGIVVCSLKVIVDRPRPYAVLQAQATGQLSEDSGKRLSFPSGDTAAVFGATTAILPAFGWPLQGLFLCVCVVVGALRVAGMAHYPSDVLAGAAIGALAGWLAVRLVDKWGHADRPVPFENWLLLAGVVGIPAGVGVTEGWAESLLVLRTYGALVLLVLLAAKIGEAFKRVGLDGILLSLARVRLPAVLIAFAAAIVEDAWYGEKPRELFSLEEPASLIALFGFGLVLIGALIRLWASARRDREETLADGRYRVVRHPMHLGSFLVVCGLLSQFDDWANWLIVLPVFIACYGASMLCEHKGLERRLRPQGASHTANVPTSMTPPLPRLRKSWSWRTYAGMSEVWLTLALVCLPLLIEFVIEDLLFEGVLGIR